MCCEQVLQSKASIRKTVFRCSALNVPLNQREPLLHKRGKSDDFLQKKFAMSLFCTIFAFGNGREVATLGFVFPECLRSASTLPSLPEAKKGRRQAQGKVAAQPRHKQEFLDIIEKCLKVRFAKKLKS